MLAHEKLQSAQFSAALLSENTFLGETFPFLT